MHAVISLQIDSQLQHFYREFKHLNTRKRGTFKSFKLELVEKETNQKHCCSDGPSREDKGENSSNNNYRTLITIVLGGCRLITAASTMD